MWFGIDRFKPVKNNWPYKTLNFVIWRVNIREICRLSHYFQVLTIYTDSLRILSARDSLAFKNDCIHDISEYFPRICNVEPIIRDIWISLWNLSWAIPYQQESINQEDCVPMCLHTGFVNIYLCKPPLKSSAFWEHCHRSTWIPSIIIVFASWSQNMTGTVDFDRWNTKAVISYTCFHRNYKIECFFFWGRMFLKR